MASQTLALTLDEILADQKKGAAECAYELPRDEDDLLICCYHHCEAPIRSDDVDAYIAHLKEHAAADDKLLPAMLSPARSNRITVSRRRNELALSGGVVAPPKKRKVRVDDHGFDIALDIEVSVCVCVKHMKIAACKFSFVDVFGLLRERD